MLAQRKPKRGRRRRNGRREPAVRNRTPIHQRPTKPHLRSQFGHWEGDLMHFRRQRDILLTLQERRSRLTLARRLLGKDADLATEAIAGNWAGPARARRTIAHDNGGEFARHEAVTGAIGLAAYFCDPHSPWQRGAIENANGRLRRDLPHQSSLGDYGDGDIDEVVWTLNATRRKCLGYRTPIEASRCANYPEATCPPALAVPTEHPCVGCCRSAGSFSVSGPDYGRARPASMPIRGKCWLLSVRRVTMRSAGHGALRRGRSRQAWSPWRGFSSTIRS
jgi:hypothetical protein